MDKLDNISSLSTVETNSGKSQKFKKVNIEYPELINHNVKKFQLSPRGFGQVVFKEYQKPSLVVKEVQEEQQFTEQDKDFILKKLQLPRDFQEFSQNKPNYIKKMKDNSNKCSLQKSQSQGTLPFIVEMSLEDSQRQKKNKMFNIHSNTFDDFLIHDNNEFSLQKSKYPYFHNKYKSRSSTGGDSDEDSNYKEIINRDNSPIKEEIEQEQKVFFNQENDKINDEIKQLQLKLQKISQQNIKYIDNLEKKDSQRSKQTLYSLYSEEYIEDNKIIEETIQNDDEDVEKPKIQQSNRKEQLNFIKKVVNYEGEYIKGQDQLIPNLEKEHFQNNQPQPIQEDVEEEQ